MPMMSPEDANNICGSVVDNMPEIESSKNEEDDDATSNKTYSDDEAHPTDESDPNHDDNLLSTSMQINLRPHPEDTVAYITVSDPVQHTEGLKGKFTMYKVSYEPPPPVDVNDNQTTPLFPYTTSVNRRYSDFSWLFDHLHKERPGAIVPPLPEKQQVSRFSEAFIEERRFHLEIFLRRVVRNPELKDTECLLVFLGGGDDEFKKAKKDANFGRGSGSDAANNGLGEDDNYNEGMENGHSNDYSHGDQSKLMGAVDIGKEKISHKKAGLKKWLKEKKTTMQGTMIRSPDDAVFEEVSHYVSALEAGLRRIEAQASFMVKRDKDNAASLLEFGLGCDALGHIDDEMNGASSSSSTEGASGIAQTFRVVGKTADALSVLSSDHHQNEIGCFLEPIRDHLKMVHAVKVALSKRNNRRITYSTLVNSVDSKKSSLHKYRITPGLEGKAYGVESSLTRAEVAVEEARVNYEEVSQRVLREVDRFRKENATQMYATMLSFAKAQKEYHEKLNSAWGALLPQLESVNIAQFGGPSFVQAAASVREVRSVGGHSSGLTTEPAIQLAATPVQNMPMPSDPPPPVPPSISSKGIHGMIGVEESSKLNGTVRYRDPLPPEE
mmetsp:Transcript_27566/g.55644  ORF Transcript_27566/g.55644 Transcript_27566/m.55644 type:complete len:610 (-) Transcript_27566:152-1981(-)